MNIKTEPKRSNNHTIKFCKPSLWLRFCSWWTGGRIVVLIDAWGWVTFSLAYLNPLDNSYECHVYYSTKVGYVILNPDFTTDKNSESAYIKAWRFYEGVSVLNQSNGVIHIRHD